MNEALGQASEASWGLWVPLSAVRSPFFDWRYPHLQHGRKRATASDVGKLVPLGRAIASASTVSPTGFDYVRRPDSVPIATFSAYHIDLPTKYRRDTLYVVSNRSGQILDRSK